MRRFPISSGVVDRPMQTKCGHVFCKECLDPLELCPSCRDPLRTLDGARLVQSLDDVNKPMARMLQNIKVHCPYKGADADQLASGEPSAKRQCLLIVKVVSKAEPAMLISGARFRKVVAGDRQKDEDPNRVFRRYEDVNGQRPLQSCHRWH